MPESINLASTSRYRATRLYVGNATSVLEFGIYYPPDQFEAVQGDETTHIVTQDEVGFLDAVAAREYGTDFESMWWVLGRLNGIVDPESEMYPGQVLLVPPIARVRQYTQG